MTDFSYMYKSLFAGRTYSTYTIKSVSSIWALVLLVTVRTTWGGMFGCWSYCRKFKGVGEGEHGAHPFWGGGMDCFFFFISLGGGYVWGLELSWNIRKDKTEEEGGRGGMWQIPSRGGGGVRIFSWTSWGLEEQHAMHIFQVMIAVTL